MGMRGYRRNEDVHKRLRRWANAPRRPVRSERAVSNITIAIGVCAVCAVLLAGATGGTAAKRHPCKPSPLTLEEARQLLEFLPYVAEDRRSGLTDHFALDHESNAWYVFRVEVSPAPPHGSPISGYEAVNRYTADIADPILLCKEEPGSKELVRLQNALRRSHCLGPSVLKKYRDRKRYPCLN
jgi:hypothetical protein